MQCVAALLQHVTVMSMKDLRLQILWNDLLLHAVRRTSATRRRAREPQYLGIKVYFQMICSCSHRTPLDMPNISTSQE